MKQSPRQYRHEAAEQLVSFATLCISSPSAQMTAYSQEGDGKSFHPWRGVCIPLRSMEGDDSEIGLWLQGFVLS